MKTIFKEEEIEKLADNYIKKVKEKIKEDIADGMYNDLSWFLYEHYQNLQSKIESELIGSITEQYKKDPMDYKYWELRKKMFEENKEQLTKDLTDESIMLSVETVIHDYTHREYHFNWKWKEWIVRIIWDNWDKFKDDEKIKNWFDRKIDQQAQQIKNLEERLLRYEPKDYE